MVGTCKGEGLVRYHWISIENVARRRFNSACTQKHGQKEWGISTDGHIMLPSMMSIGARVVRGSCVGQNPLITSPLTPL